MNNSHGPPMTACPAESTLQMFVEGTLPADECKRTAKHTATCSGCRRRIAEYKQLMWDLQQLDTLPHVYEESTAETAPGAAVPEATAHAALYDELMHAWHTQQTEDTAQRRGSRRWLPAWAGFSVQWTRNLPGVERLSAALRRPDLSPQAAWRSVAKWVGNKWASR